MIEIRPNWNRLDLHIYKIKWWQIPIIPIWSDRPVNENCNLLKVWISFINCSLLIGWLQRNPQSCTLHRPIHNYLTKLIKVIVNFCEKIWTILIQFFQSLMNKGHNKTGKTERPTRLKRPTRHARGHSLTMWTQFSPLLTTTYLYVNKNRDYLDHLPPFLVHVVIECPQRP